MRQRGKREETWASLGITKRTKKWFCWSLVASLVPSEQPEDGKHPLTVCGCFHAATPRWVPVMCASVLFPAMSLSGGDIDQGNQLWTDTDITLTHTRNTSRPFNTSSFLWAFTSSGFSWSPWPCHMSVSCWHFIPELRQELWIRAVLFYGDDLSFVLKSWLEASSKIRASQCKSLKKHVSGDSPALEMWIQHPLYP